MKMKKIRKEIFASLMALMLGISGCSNISTNKNSNSQDDTGSTNNPKVSNVKDKVGFEQNPDLFNDNLVSEAKQSLKATDKIKVVISMEGDPLVTEFVNSNANYDSAASFAKSKFGREAATSMLEQQNSLATKLMDEKIISEKGFQYTTIMNGFSATIKYGDLELLSNYEGVKEVIVSNTYAVPQAVTNVVQVYETGIFDSSDVSYSGKGTVVAVLDTGYDYTHSVFSTMPEAPSMNLSSVEAIVEQTQANKLNTAGAVRAEDLYINAKIPFAYDYGDMDVDIYPQDADHGTHVAGIIGGKDDTITGVAVNTQLALMKVFSDKQDGAETVSILAALEDAVLLNVDAINMSLGMSVGFTREVDEEATNRVYDSIKNAGISLVVAASNDYSSAFGSIHGNTNSINNPDSGTVGSPATYEAALSVASINGQLDPYFLANTDDEAIFFQESANNAGEDYHFIEMMNIPATGDKEFEYVTVPGYGFRSNYAALDVRGKVALVKRGNNTFEEKMRFAADAGAIACIIYNNVSGDIKMSLGNEIRIPTISIQRGVGEKMAATESGKIIFNRANLAGPFMSDFSSWGPTPSLELKPEITAHGGNIYSAIPGGGYDHYSGTSMASPNMAGIAVLIRQYVKEKFPTLNRVEITDLVNELVMSTATTVLNQYGNPYSPRKQGAGLASLYNAVNTLAYIYVEGQSRPKLELKDDKEQTGEYEFIFNVKNISDTYLGYDVETIAMTESLSDGEEYDDFKTVAELAYMLGGKQQVSAEGAIVIGSKVYLNPNADAKITVKYQLSDADKKYITDTFANGMYVEGFVKLVSRNTDKIDLSIPFLSFFGDWTKAPMFDKDFYEIETEAHNGAIDDEDKISPDLYASTPFGRYHDFYIIPLGSYIYDYDESKYDAQPAIRDKAAISTGADTINGIYAVYTGLLRPAKEMRVVCRNVATGEIVFEHVDYNARKTFYYSGAGGTYPYYEEYEDFYTQLLGLENNTQYEFTMEGRLDYEDDGTTNLNNTFSFSFYVDTQAPTIEDVRFYKEYDRSTKKYKSFVDLVVSDNHYVQSIRPGLIEIVDGRERFIELENYPIPVYGERDSKTTVKIEITDYLEAIYNGAEKYNNQIIFYVDDYAMNYNLFMVPLAGTDNTNISFGDSSSQTISVNQTINLNELVTISGVSDEESTIWAESLIWSSSRPLVAEVKNGLAVGHAKGTTTITATSPVDSSVRISMQLTVLAEGDEGYVVTDPSTLESVRINKFETVAAFEDDLTRNAIGSVGSINYFGTSGSSLEMYPSEQVRLLVELKPWNINTRKVEFTWSVNNERIIKVDDNGLLTAIGEGSASVTLRVSVDGKQSLLMDRVSVTVNSEFVVEGGLLTGYKGFGGDVVIPEDLNLTAIYSYAFSLKVYKDQVTETEFYDPLTNRTLTSVVIPEGVETIYEYAFANCLNLTTVVLPKSLTAIYKNAFYSNIKLTTINLENVTKIGDRAFSGCGQLTNIDTRSIISLGDYAFENCIRITSADLTLLRASGYGVFQGCRRLTDVTFGPLTSINSYMFAQSGLTTVNYPLAKVPSYAFYRCTNLESVNFTEDVRIDNSAFAGCSKLANVTFEKTARIGTEAFANTSALVSLTLPNGQVELGSYAFANSGLTTLLLQANTQLAMNDIPFANATNLSDIIVDASNAYYVSVNGILYNKTQTAIVLAATGYDFNDLVIPETVKEIYPQAFATNTNITSVSFKGTMDLIGSGAFEKCSNLKTLILPETINEMGSYVFAETGLTAVTNLDKLTTIAEYAFAQTRLTEVSFANNVAINEGAFYKCSALKAVNFAGDSVIGFAAFQESGLETVNVTGTLLVGEQAFFKSNLATIDFSKVNEIGAYAFANTQLTNVVLNDNIEVIAAGAFANSKLETITANNVEIIMQDAFSGATSLTTYQGAALLIIGNNAFENATKLVNINLVNVTEIGSSAFKNATSLVSVEMPKVEMLKENAFENATSLKTVEFKVLEEVPANAFSGCGNLETVILGAVTTIQDRAFYDTQSLSNINLEVVREIGEYAFYRTNINSANLNSALKLDDGAFAYSKIAVVTFENVSSIGNLTFAGTLLETVTLPNTLSSVGKMAFGEIATLKEFLAAENNSTVNTQAINENIKIDNGVLYVTLPNGLYELHTYPAAKTATSYQVIENTARIASYAVVNTHINEITLPYTLATIADFAFANSTNLKTYHFTSYIAPTLESTYNSNFSVTNSEISSLPEEMQKLYKYEEVATTYYYSNFVDYIGRVSGLEMTRPVNGVGYENFIYRHYFAKTTTTDIVMTTKTYDALNLLSVIPNINEITLADATLVSDARTNYNAAIVDTTQRDFFSNELVTKLQAAENKIAELKGEEPVNTEIPEIPTLDIELDSELIALLEKLGIIIIIGNIIVFN